MSALVATPADPVTSHPRRLARARGFTIIELLTVVVVLGLLASFAVTRTKYTVQQAKTARAMGDIRALTADVIGFSTASTAQTLPVSLGAVERAGMLDPWGNPYVYVAFVYGGSPRTDVFGIDLNTLFDIYSMGPDGTSALSITAGPGQDDVVLGSDGGFIGRASRY